MDQKDEPINPVAHSISMWDEDDAHLFHLHESIVNRISDNFEAWSFVIQINLLSLQSEVETPEQQRIVERWDFALSEGISELKWLALQIHDEENEDNGSSVRRMSPMLGIISFEEQHETEA